jgi:hypothetical protein
VVKRLVEVTANDVGVLADDEPPKSAREPGHSRLTHRPLR